MQSEAHPWLFVPGPLGWVSDTGYSQTLCVTGLGLSICSYHNVHGFCLSTRPVCVWEGSIIVKLLASSSYRAFKIETVG